MSIITVTDREGVEHQVEIDAGQSLMEVLRDKNLGIDGACGGAACCGTCHVYVAKEWAQKMPVDEIENLTLEGLIHLGEGSRLSCQVDTMGDIDGLALRVAPHEI